MSDEPERAAASRFMVLEDVARELSTSNAQVYALVRSKALPAIKLGGRGQWRVERAKLEQFIEKAYADTEEWIDKHPFGGDAESDEN
jgi:excisionase family DNA binding protein